ncbi:MAG: YggT family protein [Gemmatimonadales bacterium]
MSLVILRVVVFAVFAGSVVVAVGSWLVRSKRINPFGSTAKMIRSLADPVLSPLERLILRRGGNPQNAEWWLLGITAVGGIVVISLTGWIGRQLALVAAAGSSGPRGLLRLSIYYAGQIVLISLVVRVIGSWFGVGRFSKWMRPFYLLTDWIVQPLRRIIPPIGRIDITPIVAWFALQIVLGWIIRIL